MTALMTAASVALSCAWLFPSCLHAKRCRIQRHHEAWLDDVDVCAPFADKPALTRMYIEEYNNNTFDIMVMPTTPITAPPIYSVEPYMLFNGKYVSNRVALRRTAIIEATVGAPGLSIPMGLASDGMPNGIQIQSRPGEWAFISTKVLHAAFPCAHMHVLSFTCIQCSAVCLGSLFLSILQYQ